MSRYRPHCCRTYHRSKTYRNHCHSLDSSPTLSIFSCSGKSIEWILVQMSVILKRRLLSFSFAGSGQAYWWISEQWWVHSHLVRCPNLPWVPAYYHQNRFSQAICSPSIGLNCQRWMYSHWSQTTWKFANQSLRYHLPLGYGLVPQQLLHYDCLALKWPTEFDGLNCATCSKSPYSILLSIK